MGRVFVTTAAEQARVEIWLHIAQDNPVAADRVLDEIDEKSLAYSRQPEMGDPRQDLGSDVRCFSVGNYVVIYRPVEDGIVILLVVHGARDVPAVLHRSLTRGDEAS